MLRLLHKLHYKIGKYYISNLMLYIVIAQAAVFAFDYLFIDRGMSLQMWLYFDRGLILSGQVWRIITFIIVPFESNPIFMFIMMILYVNIGRTLENAWGGFYFNAFYFIGVIGSIIGGFITGFATIDYINTSIFLAFALLYPHMQFLLFFIIPVKAKWLAIIYLAFIGIEFVLSPLPGKVAILISFVNIVIFFWDDYFPKIRDKFRYRKIRRSYRREMK
ncbi:MAG: hypothetical protein LBM87_00135 [Ruminococcus sp.]|jgi:hypothetical protein|nr:hypothetical protein [Ruminococcus sp.]